VLEDESRARVIVVFRAQDRRVAVKGDIEAQLSAFQGPGNHDIAGHIPRRTSPAEAVELFIILRADDRMALAENRGADTEMSVRGVIRRTKRVKRQECRIDPSIGCRVSQHGKSGVAGRAG
jgi:hypothetical protein